MAMQPLKVLYTGVWGSGYVKVGDTFSRISISDILLVVFLDNKFKLTAKTVEAEHTFEVDSFSLTGNATVVRDCSGTVDEILLSHICCGSTRLGGRNTYSISRKACTCLPVPYGEAFFSFSSRLPPVEFDFKSGEPFAKEVSNRIPLTLTEPFVFADGEMSFDDLFEQFRDD